MAQKIIYYIPNLTVMQNTGKHKEYTKALGSILEKCFFLSVIQIFF